MDFKFLEEAEAYCAFCCAMTPLLCFGHAPDVYAELFNLPAPEDCFDPPC